MSGPVKMNGARRLLGIFQPSFPPRLKLGKDPGIDREAKLEELRRLYSEKDRRVHAPTASGDLSLTNARNLRRKRTLLKEIVADRLPREELLREVRTLEANPRFEKPTDYWDALDNYLVTPMILETIPRHKDRAESLGSTSYDPVRNRIYVSLSHRLGWWNAQYALAHEAGHVAANHEFPVLDGNGGISGYERPPAGLTRIPPFDDDLPRPLILDLQDEEAELRARYTWLVCGLGKRALDLVYTRQRS